MPVLPPGGEATASRASREEFGLHPLAVEAALRPSQRSKLDRYGSHLLLTAYGARLDTGTGGTCGRIGALRGQPGVGDVATAACLNSTPYGDA